MVASQAISPKRPCLEYYPGYWWDGMRSDVRRQCRSYLTCATRKGHLQPIRGTNPNVPAEVLDLPTTGKTSPVTKKMKPWDRYGACVPMDSTGACFNCQGFL